MWKTRSIGCANIKLWESILAMPLVASITAIVDPIALHSFRNASIVSVRKQNGIRHLLINRLSSTYWHVNSCLLHRPWHPWGSSDPSRQSGRLSQKRAFDIHCPLLHVNSFSEGHAGMKRNVVANVLRDYELVCT